MLNILISGIFLFSLVTSILNGTTEPLCNELLAAPQKAFELALSVGFGLCLWSGVMEVARQAGLLRAVSALFRPVLSLLFPQLKPDSPAAQAICTNLAANLLGLGAAAAPAGIQAVQEMQALCPDPAVASPSSILLILLNTASLQLIPTTAAVLRLQAGSAAPMEILPAVWVTSLLSVMVGILAAKLMERLTCSVSCPRTKEEAL